MLAYERGYRVARLSFALLALVGWIGIAAGIAVAIAGFAGSAVDGSLLDTRNLLLQLASMSPGLGIAVGGLFAVATAHIGRAIADTAAMTRELLVLAQESAEARAEPVHAAPPPPVPVVAPEPAAEAPKPRFQEAPPARSRQLMLAPVRAPEPEDEPEREDEVYRQVHIAGREDGYYIRDRRFESIDDARIFIDRALAKAGLKAER